MRPSVIVLYFFIGFSLGTAATMVLTSLLRPILLGLGQTGSLVGFLSPFLIGVFGGFRTALFGYRDRNRVVDALRRAFLFRPS